MSREIAAMTLFRLMFPFRVIRNDEWQFSYVPPSRFMALLFLRFLGMLQQEGDPVAPVFFGLVSVSSYEPVLPSSMKYVAMPLGVTMDAMPAAM